MRLMVVTMLCTGLALAYSGGPPDAKTGAPGEGTCADCHSSTGSGDSTLLAGIPAGSYVPDSLYVLTLSVSFAGQRRWGFELTCLDTADSPAGQLLVIDSVQTSYSLSGGRQYLKQTGAGTQRGSTGSVWQLGWRAPAVSVGPVTFHWCANACNNDNSTSGDHALTDSLIVWPTGVAEVRGPAGYGWYYLNPAQNRVVIHYRGATARPVRIYSAAGDFVCAVRPEHSGSSLRAVWDGTDHSGKPVPEASYFVRLGDEVRSVIKIQLIR
jgi:hypothetical protein